MEKGGFFTWRENPPGKKSVDRPFSFQEADPDLKAGQNFLTKKT